MINILEIITGHTGVDHVTSADDASLYRALFGGQDAVLNVGSQFEYTVISNNLIKIADGDLVVQGHQARIRTNDYEELVIDNGTPSMQRHDLIVARYEKDVVSGVESIKLEVVKGTPALIAVDPELTQDDITSGGTLREFPLYRVKLNGINIEAVEKMFDTVSQDLMNLQFESGSNDDGSYIRFGNGLQICRHDLEVDINTSIAMGPAYRSERTTWDYPKPFIEPPFFDPKSSIVYGRWGVVLNKPEKETAHYSIMGFTNTSTLNGVHLLAIGRWK